MSRTTQILAFSVPPTVVKEVESLAKKERRTKSELFREMVRVYERYSQQRQRDEERWVVGLIAEAQSEQAQKPMSPKVALAEDARLARYGAAQARKLGIKPENINRLIHDRRKARKA